MDKCFARRVHGPRLKPLASCLALALALSTGTVAATTSKLLDRPAISTLLPNWQSSGTPFKRAEHDRSELALYPALRPSAQPIGNVPTGSVPVTNCDDSGPGSLRDVIAGAVSGQTIDLTATGCSSITLTTGDIFITQEDLTLQGPGAAYLLIDGNNLYSLRHSNAAGGTLSVADLAMENGRKYLDSTINLNAKGGCLYSYGTVEMSNVFLGYCTAETANTAYYAAGGAVYGREGVIMVHSTIVFSGAGSPTTVGGGGAIFTPGAAVIAYSGIGFDYASTVGGAVFSEGGNLTKYSTLIINQSPEDGGVYSGGNVTIENSTIAWNSATAFGGLYLSGNGATSPLSIINSTISGNTAQAVGGLVVTYPTSISNSTIAFNSEQNSGDVKYGAGLFAAGPTDIESTIIARNTLYHSAYGPIIDDIGGGITLTGASNLTQFVVAGTFAPPDTIYDDPRLSQLAYHGGLTTTHVLAPSSPAIETGNNVAMTAYDQRGTGFPRVIGANADIGATEFNLDDFIFADGFDG